MRCGGWPPPRGAREPGFAGKRGHAAIGSAALLVRRLTGYLAGADHSCQTVPATVQSGVTTSPLRIWTRIRML
jgi:hypothetical protein